MSAQALTVAATIEGQAVSGSGQFAVEGFRGLVGAYINPAVFGTTLPQAIADWEAITGRTLRARRVYYPPGQIPAAITPDLQADVAAGRKACISLRPAFNPVSATDASKIATFLSSCASAGLMADVALWHEPNGAAGMTALRYVSMVSYYEVVVRPLYPLVHCTSAYFDQHSDPSHAWYPGDSHVDKIATDIYCSEYSGGVRLGTSAAVADAAGKPFGIWEFNSSIQQSQVQATAFFGYLQSYFSNRTMLMKPNADLLLFNSDSNPVQETPITSSADYRVPLYQGLTDNLQ